MRGTDRQTDIQTHRHADGNTLQYYQGRSNKTDISEIIDYSIQARKNFTSQAAKSCPRATNFDCVHGLMYICDLQRTETISVNCVYSARSKERL